MYDDFPCQLEIPEGTYEIDRDQRGYPDVFEVYETVPAEQTGPEFLQPTRGRLMFRVSVDGLDQDHVFKAEKKIRRELALPEGLAVEDRWRWIHRRTDEICAKTEEYRLMGES